MLGHRALNVEDYLAILKRRWWIIAIPAIIAPILAVGATFFVAPEYVSQSLLLIDQQKVPSDFVKPIETESIDNRVASMQAQILSRSSILPIIEKYNLYASDHLDTDARVDKVRKAIKIVAVESNIAGSNGLPGFTISFTASDPHTAQQVCAEVTSLFTGADLRSQAANAEGTTQFIQSQLNQAKQTLDDQDAKLAAFQSRYFGMLPSDEPNNVNILNTLNSQLEAATQSLTNLEQTQSLDETFLAQQPQSSETDVSAVQQPQAEQKELDDLEAQEAQLSLHYTDDYPDLKDVRRKIADLQKKMNAQAATPAPAKPAAPAPKRPDSAQVQRANLQLKGLSLAIADKRKQQGQIEQQIRSYQGRIQSSPEVEEEYKQLTRDYQTAQSFYDHLLSEMQQTNMATDLANREEGETFRVLDPSNFPDAPIFPKPIVFGMGGLVGGIALGVLIVALLEYRDTALRSERDVWAFTQLPTLAVIAWSGDMVFDSKHAKPSFLKRLFRRKTSKKLLADAPG